MKKERVIIKFEGNEHQIDANTLISVLTHYTAIVDVANKEFGGGCKNVKLQVDALEKGSFDVVLSLSEGLKGLFSSDTVQYLSGLTTISTGVFSLYKYFKGKPIKTQEDKQTASNIVNITDMVVINSTINVYNQPIIREAVSKSLEKANEDPNVDGISLKAKDEECVRFEKAEFADLIYKDFDKESLPREQAVYIDNAILTITALNFSAGGTWKFLYNGFPISMTVKDDALMKAIDNGARFGKGDSLRVKLKINQRFDEGLQGYVNISYRIEEFNEHIPVVRQGVLF